MHFQLGTFCVAALNCLGVTSLYPFKYAEKYYDKETLFSYFESLDWNRSSNSGNKVMFMAISFIHNYESFGINEAKKGLDYWFEWMDSHTNSTGFWGKGKSSHYFEGMAGFYHQFMIYFYMKRKIKKYQNVIDKLLFLQQPDGLFYPVNGGGSCMDIDSITPLCFYYKNSEYRQNEIRNTLLRALPSLLSNQREDGGFCWAATNFTNPKHFIYLFTNLFFKEDFYHWSYCIRRFLIGKIFVRSTKPKKLTGWTLNQRLETESSLFDTWLRCTSIFQIVDTLSLTKNRNYRFLDFPGLAWFINPKQ